MVGIRAGFAVLAAAVVCAVGCASGESYVREGYNFGGLRKVAIADVTGQSRSEGVRNYVGDLFAAELLTRGYNVFERQQVKAVLSEQEFQSTDFTSEEGAARLGRIENVDAVLVANVTRFDEDGAALTAKLVGVEDGQLLWTGSGEGRTGRVSLALLGGAIGGLFGWLAAHDEENKVATGAAGAVVGAAVGLALTPNEERILKDVVRKVTRKFPTQMKRQ